MLPNDERESSSTGVSLWQRLGAVFAALLAVVVSTTVDRLPPTAEVDGIVIADNDDGDDDDDDSDDGDDDDDDDDDDAGSGGGGGTGSGGRGGL